jgi:anti-sigma factor RsiW
MNVNGSAANSMESFRGDPGSNATMTSRLRFARDHRSVPRLLSGYLEGDLAARQRARIQRHLAECPECRSLLRSLQQMIARFKGVPPPPDNPAPRDLADAVRARLDELGHGRDP